MNRFYYSLQTHYKLTTNLLPIYYSLYRLYDHLLDLVLSHSNEQVLLLSTNSLQTYYKSPTDLYEPLQLYQGLVVQPRVCWWVKSLQIQVLIFLLAGKPAGTQIGVIFFYFLLCWSLDSNIFLFWQVQPFNQNLDQNAPALLDWQLPNSLFLCGDSVVKSDFLIFSHWVFSPGQPGPANGPTPSSSHATFLAFHSLQGPVLMCV